MKHKHWDILTEVNSSAVTMKNTTGVQQKFIRFKMFHGLDPRSRDYLKVIGSKLLKFSSGLYFCPGVDVLKIKCPLEFELLIFQNA